MKVTVNSGASIATLAAALFLAGAVASVPVASAAETGHCIGANACKGQSACKSSSNSCQGQNGCKGQGFKELTKDECAKIEGAKFEPAK